ncbi:MAG: cob(I)yrinic acid a,c-diamide adenosyltransferase [Lachnospiraceae bacterium]|nr:cob(I)yrinic acid a,c-diamide adenosyltransferase [Lachnospiraceae bacterium]
METGSVQIYYGAGCGKTDAALGNALIAASENKNVIIIQFLKGKTGDHIQFMQRLEPEIRFFCFEKSEGFYEELTQEEQEEEKLNMKNGLNFAKKVLVTGECNLLILDEILGVIDTGIISAEELKNVLDCKTEDTEIIMTGRCLNESIRAMADRIYNISSEK